MGFFDDEGDDILGLGAAIGAPSPNPKKRRAGLRRYERALNKKVYDSARRVWQKNQKMQKAGAVTGRAALPTATAAGRGAVLRPTAAAPTKPGPSMTGGGAKAPTITTTRGPIRPGMHGLLGAMLGDLGDPTVPGDPDYDPNYVPPSALPAIDDTGNATQGSDQFGVPVGWLPKNASWISRDLWEGRAPWTFNGVPAKFRIAVPAIDQNYILGWPEFDEYGFVRAQYRSFENRPDTPNVQGRPLGGDGVIPPVDRFSGEMGFDDLKWGPVVTGPSGTQLAPGAHMPTNNMAMRWAFSRYLDLIDNFATMGQGKNVGTFSGLGAAEVGLPMPYRQIDFGWQLSPADFWRVDLASADAAWFDPYNPVPIDLLSYYVAGLVPDQYKDQTPDQFWSKFVRTDDEVIFTGPGGAKTRGFGLGKFLRSYNYSGEAYPGSLPTTAMDQNHQGRGALTVYLPDDAPRAGIGGSMKIGPIGSFKYGGEVAAGDGGTPPAPPIGEPVSDQPYAEPGQLPAEPGAYDQGGGMPPTYDDGGGIPSYDQGGGMPAGGGGFYSEQATYFPGAEEVQAQEDFPTPGEGGGAGGELYQDPDTGQLYYLDADGNPILIGAGDAGGAADAIADDGGWE